MKAVIVFPLVALALSAQVIVPVIGVGASVPDSVRRYLELTPEQVTAVERLNESFIRFRSDKSMRSFVVNFEIQEHLGSANPDPMALGLRYVELEAIRREVEAEQKKTVGEAQKLLTPVQRTRVAALEEVLKTYGTACDAVAVNLLQQPQPQLGGLSFLPTPSIGGLLLGTSACSWSPTAFDRFYRGGDGQPSAVGSRNDSMRR